MTGDDTPATVAPDPLASEFSPDLLRRLGAPIARGVLGKLLGAQQAMRADQFARLGAPPDHVVMLGDSITAGGLWHEWFGEIPVLNRGVDGETSADLLRRLDSAVHDPVAIFLLIGTNDLTVGASLPDITGNVRALLAEVDERASGTPVVVQSVMPRTRRFREDIQLLNRAYRAIVARAGGSVEFLDLWPALADDDGGLRSAYTADGLHLNGHGYAAWVELLRPVMDRLARGR